MSYLLPDQPDSVARDIFDLERAPSAALLETDFVSSKRVQGKGMFRSPNSFFEVTNDLSLLSSEKKANFAMVSSFGLTLNTQEGSKLHLKLRPLKFLAHADFGIWRLERGSYQFKLNPYAFLFGNRDHSRFVLAAGARTFLCDNLWVEDRLALVKEGQDSTAHYQNGLFWRRGRFSVSSFISYQLAAQNPALHKRLHLLWRDGRLDAGLEL